MGLLRGVTSGLSGYEWLWGGYGLRVQIGIKCDAWNRLLVFSLFIPITYGLNLGVYKRESLISDWNCETEFQKNEIAVS